MWMSDCLIVVDRNNADKNSISDIAAAVRELGAVQSVDDTEHVIEATIPSHELATVKAIDGVSYVRCVFSYLCGSLPPKAA